MRKGTTSSGEKPRTHAEKPKEKQQRMLNRALAGQKHALVELVSPSAREGGHRPLE